MDTNKYGSTNKERDEKLWRLAKRRASFKRHFATYLIMNAFFWAVWFFSTRGRSHYGLPWPVWPMLGWGIGLAFHYIGAYVSPETNSVEREYEKLKKEQENK
jgi:hypothetical protein